MTKDNKKTQFYELENQLMLSSTCIHAPYVYVREYISDGLFLFVIQVFFFYQASIRVCQKFFKKKKLNTPIMECIFNYTPETTGVPIIWECSNFGPN